MYVCMYCWIFNKASRSWRWERASLRYLGTLKPNPFTSCNSPPASSPLGSGLRESTPFRPLNSHGVSGNVMGGRRKYGRQRMGRERVDSMSLEHVLSCMRVCKRASARAMPHSCVMNVHGEMLAWRVAAHGPLLPRMFAHVGAYVQCMYVPCHSGEAIDLCV